MSRANQAGQQNWKISEESQQTIQKQYMYRNDPKFSDRYAWANSADPVWSGSTLFAIPSASFGLITLW